MKNKKTLTAIKLFIYLLTLIVTRFSSNNVLIWIFYLIATPLIIHDIYTTIRDVKEINRNK